MQKPREIRSENAFPIATRYLFPVTWTSMSSTAIVIPARMGSTRLPQKAMADIHGKPMCVRVAERAALVKNVSDIIVATDHEVIKAAVEQAGFKAVMTPPELKSGTDRVAHVARNLKHEFIVNLQGDEPVVPPEAIQAAMEPVLRGETLMGSVMTPFRSAKDFENPACVKVLTDHKNHAIYFSRHAIPYRQNPTDLNELLREPHLGKHMGIYVYTRKFLLEFAELPPTFLEKAESLEQLRALYNGVKIGMGTTDRDSQSVDTAEDLEKARKIFKELKDHKEQNK